MDPINRKSKVNLMNRKISEYIVAEGKAYATEAVADEYFAQMDKTGAVNITLELFSDSTDETQLMHRDMVYIKTQEVRVEGYNCLGAFKDSSLYYYTSGYEGQKWTVFKRGLDENDEPVGINEGDYIAFKNEDWEDQYMIPNSGWLTSVKKEASDTDPKTLYDRYYWRITQTRMP